jgi:hypothetical protein
MTTTGDTMTDSDPTPWEQARRTDPDLARGLGLVSTHLRAVKRSDMADAVLEAARLINADPT